MIAKAGLLLAELIVLLLVWQLLYDNTDFLPAPADTWDATLNVLSEGGTWASFIATLRRLVIGLGLGYLTGVGIALMMSASRWWHAFFRPFVVVGLSVPSLATALIALMIFGRSEFGVAFAVAVVIYPFVTVALLDGLGNRDPALSEMATIYRFRLFQRLRHETLPEIAPYLSSAFRSVHAIAWRIVVIAELFSQPNGLGFEYLHAFEFFSIERLLVWAAVFIAFVTIAEYGLIRPLETRTSRWRQRESGRS